jgi:hypothetical protein
LPKLRKIFYVQSKSWGFHTASVESGNRTASAARSGIGTKSVVPTRGADEAGLADGTGDYLVKIWAFGAG